MRVFYLALLVLAGACKTETTKSTDKAPGIETRYAFLSTDQAAALRPEELCPRAYEQTKAVLARPQPTAAPGTPQPFLADRKTFIDGCNDLPEPVRRCLLFEFAAANMSYCTRERDKHNQKLALDHANRQPR